jgi:3-oxoacyl-[acyl-carrier protein] reductase
MSRMFSLKGKVALVTGAGSGIGASIAETFARAGARVFVADRDERGGHATTQTIRDAGGLGEFLPLDVTNEAQCEDARSAIHTECGRLDILVNNAGFSKPAMLLKMTEEQWDQVVDLHLKGAFLCTQAAAQIMKEQKSGKMINVTSVAGLVGTVGQINYSAAKGGLLPFTKSAARELARYNICVNVISLGIVATDMTEKIRSDEKLKEIYMRRILLERFAEPDDITPAFVFLASDEANYITGQLLCVDGGYGMI